MEVIFTHNELRCPQCGRKMQYGFCLKDTSETSNYKSLCPVCSMMCTNYNMIPEQHQHDMVPTASIVEQLAPGCIESLVEIYYLPSRQIYFARFDGLIRILLGSNRNNEHSRLLRSLIVSFAQFLRENKISIPSKHGNSINANWLEYGLFPSFHAIYRFIWLMAITISCNDSSITNREDNIS